MTELREAIRKAIDDGVLRQSSFGFDAGTVADAVLAAIAQTHMVIDKDRWQRVLAVARAGDGMFIVDFEVKDDDLFDDEYWENERRERAALDPLPEGA